jgi:2-keto-4-pentenoate hydratase/2-oxohepta-3-ene-1,7-dioic acid hydratase in catechol pathway
MRFLTFVDNQTGQFRLGAKTAQGVVDLAAAKATLAGKVLLPDRVEALVGGGETAIAAVREIIGQVASGKADQSWLLAEEGLVLGPCVPNPGKIIGVGLNYRRHAIESGMAIPETPVLFSKFNNTIAAPNEIVPLPETAEQYDYEVELAVIVGQRGRNIPKESALSYVFGYCTANDLSARDLQMRTGQWLLGKTLDKFMPIGPYLVTADEIEDPQNLGLKCWVNGELRQNSNTADMIFSVAELISYISQYFTLEPGDLISTGTPEGVVMGMTHKLWLNPGDTVTVEVNGLGRLTNKMGADGG